MALKEYVKLPFGFSISRDTSAESTRPLGLGQPRKRQPQANTGKAAAIDEALKTRKASGAPDKIRLSGGNTGAYRGRKSVETTDIWSNTFALWQSFSQRQHAGRMGVASSFDFENFESMDFDYLAEVLADLSPEISKALWDFLLLCNSGYEIQALDPKSDKINKKAQKALDGILETLGRNNGTLGVFFDRLFKMLFLRGANLYELVLDENGYDFVDIVTPDTKTLEFRRRLDEKRGQVWDFGQKQNGVFVSLDLPTVRYIPVHPNPDSIEGHSLCSSAFFIAIFLMAVLRDTKRVVQHQGYLRLDVEVDFQKLVDTMPKEGEENPEAVQEWMNEVIAEVQAGYSELEPDDTYVHGDSVKINNPVGTVSADSLQAIDALFKALERMAVRALKTMPLLMATDSSRSETQSNREWEIYAKGIETIQHFVETPFGELLQKALQAQGVQAKVKVRFATFRAAEKMRDAQVDFLVAKTARFLYDCGYISQDEAALMAANKKKADKEAPRAVSGAPDNLGNIPNENPNNGESRLPADAREVLEKALAPFRNATGAERQLLSVDDILHGIDPNNELVMSTGETLQQWLGAGLNGNGKH